MYKNDFSRTGKCRNISDNVDILTLILEGEEGLEALKSEREDSKAKLREYASKNFSLEKHERKLVDIVSILEQINTSLDMFETKGKSGCGRYILRVLVVFVTSTIEEFPVASISEAQKDQKHLDEPKKKLDSEIPELAIKESSEPSSSSAGMNTISQQGTREESTKLFGEHPLDASDTGIVHISYDSQATVEKKLNFAKTHDLGGVPVKIDAPSKKADDEAMVTTPSSISTNIAVENSDPEQMDVDNQQGFQPEHESVPASDSAPEMDIDTASAVAQPENGNNFNSVDLSSTDETNTIATEGKSEINGEKDIPIPE
ncbi:hypothetical protein AX774_g3391 [Zancudomyces culisetae]|uniref:Uncharacterized protein n=1 Tax=Zancudomyces culisetae TaxID=1213189 RepID=A0A1R1PEM6_ZANCU|nr:hypothetical protein AX774_g7137 [Zancudomyces culisetae]OMH83111.1 hypothetical protein AX774_g3391 [Zancudomyces culisetae]|eukprot:OMH79455.1 hypothetical protein AX774_g7137 [Zancudomyces culisetae]